MNCPKCKSQNVVIQDDSFSHEFGIEVIKYPVCNSCGFDDEEQNYNCEDWGYEE